MAQEFDEEIEGLEPKEPHPIPFGWGALFWGLVAWGAYYLWAFTPALGGWSQERELANAAGATTSTVGVHIFATILFTALATLTAVGIMVAFARRRKGG